MLMDMHMSILIKLIEDSDDVHTTYGSMSVHNGPHAQIKHVLICTKFFTQHSAAACIIWQSLACCCGVLCSYIMLRVNGLLVSYNMKVCVFVVDTAKHILCFTLVALTMHCEMPCSVKLVMWVELYQHTCICEPTYRRGMRSLWSHLNFDGSRKNEAVRDFSVVGVTALNYSDTDQCVTARTSGL